MLYVVCVMNVGKKLQTRADRSATGGRVEPIRLGPRLVRKQESRGRVITMPRRHDVAG